MPPKTSPPRQLPLALPVSPSLAATDFVADASNAAALAWLARPAEWPGGRLALHGPEATGKTHLLHIMAARGWWLAAGPALRGLPAWPEDAPGLAVDEADAVAEEAALLHLLNLAAERRQPVLLAGRAPPARWPVALADLRSRLRAITAVGLQPPTDPLLAALLEKQFADRQLKLEPGLKSWLLARLPRDAGAIAAAAARLDAAALAAGGGITRPLARAALAELPGWDAGWDDDCVAGSQPGPRLL